MVSAEQNQLAVEDSLASNQGNVALGIISVYRALGGGWQIRAGHDVVSDEVKAEMARRTDWGRLLEPGRHLPAQPCGGRRHPNQERTVITTTDLKRKTMKPDHHLYRWLRWLRVGPGGTSGGVRQAAEGAKQAPPSVTVSHPSQQAVADYLELTGTVTPSRSVDLVARVTGYLESVNFQDGAMVKEGQLLFVIEPEPYKQQLALAEATLERAQSEYEPTGQPDRSRTRLRSRMSRNGAASGTRLRHRWSWRN